LPPRQTSTVEHSGGSEQLGLVVGTDPQGGYLAPMAFVSQLIKFLDDDVTMRRLGTVLPPTIGEEVGVLSYDTDLADADWTAEVPASDTSEDDAPGSATARDDAAPADQAGEGLAQAGPGVDLPI
jgi:HK97 family phage major capsid protein